MILEHIGLNQINGPLVVLENVENAHFDEMVEIHLDNGTKRVGRVVQIEGDKVVIQVFEGTTGLSLANTASRMTGHAMELPLSPEILGRVFDGLGRPIDGLGEIYPETKADVNGKPINPVARVYPKNYINTGISSIITEHGEHLAWLAPETKGIAVAEVEMCTETTLYTRIGNLFVYLCAAFVLILYPVDFIIKRRQNRI